MKEKIQTFTKFEIVDFPSKCTRYLVS